MGIGKEDTPPPADKISDAVKNLGLNVDGLKVEIIGDKAVVKGSVQDQATLEKVIIAIGNTMGIGEVDAQLVAKDSGPEPVFHTVERGDTLSAIAKKTMGSANKYPAIFEANKPMLKHPDKIYPGQVLRIPQDG
ncbi:MAG: peptidoglycan-binding protein LysM [Alphaproteobacteria bacterium]